MNKKLNGYMTVEASFIVPIVLVLFVLIIRSGFFLYDRCVMSQDHSLLALRGSCFTTASENYGEVIYAEMEKENQNEGYIKERMQYKQQFYPFAGEVSMEVRLKKNVAVVKSCGFNRLLLVEKEFEMLNPLSVIRKEQKKRNGNKVL